MGALLGAIIKQYFTQLFDNKIETTQLWANSTIVMHCVSGSAKQ